LRTREDSQEERHATWFALFFDLVFAAALGELAASLGGHPGAATFARFVVLFVVVVWPWVLHTLYSNRFDSDDMVLRFAKSGAMLAITAVAVEVRKVIDGHGGAVSFAVANVALRVLLISLYLGAIYDVPGEGRTLSQIYAVGYGGTTALWLASVFARVRCATCCGPRQWRST
jgi:low temperature requirement protein LtrA